MDEEREFNKKHFFGLFHDPSESERSSSSEITFENQCTVKSLNISDTDENFKFKNTD